MLQQAGLLAASDQARGELCQVLTGIRRPGHLSFLQQPLKPSSHRRLRGPLAVRRATAEKRGEDSTQLLREVAVTCMLYLPEQKKAGAHSAAQPALAMAPPLVVREAV